MLVTSGARRSITMTLVAGLLAAACSSAGDDSIGVGGSASGSAESDRSTGSASASVNASALTGAATHVTADGDVVGYFGWSDHPISSVSDTPLAAHVGVCASTDSEGERGAFGVTAGGAELLNPNFEADLLPQLIPLWHWPAPGECSIGWRIMPLRSGVEPTTLVWRNLIDPDDEASWSLGSPVDPRDLGFGSVEAPGTTAATGAGHRLTVYGADEVPDAAGETVPDDAWFNAGAGYDLPPAGSVWWAVDHQYCFAPDQPGTRVGARDAAVGSWFVATPAGTMNAGPGYLAVEPPDPGDECERRFDFVAVPDGAVLTHFRWDTDEQFTVWELD